MILRSEYDIRQAAFPNPNKAFFARESLLGRQNRMRQIRMETNRSLKGIYILGIGNFLFGLGFGVYGYIFPSFLSTVGATPAEVGIVMSLLYAFQATMYIPGGILSDSGYRWKLVIASWVIPGLAPIFYLLAELNGSWLFALPGILIFAAGWIGVPATQAYTSEASPKGKRGLTFGLLISTGNIGLIPSPLIGGVILEQYGFTALFEVAFIILTAATITVLPLPRLPMDLAIRSKKIGNKFKSHSEPEIEKGPDVRKVDRDKTSKGNQMRASTSYKRLIPVLVYSCLFYGFVFVASPFIPLYLGGEYHFDYFTIQAMYSILNISALILGPTLGRVSDKYSPATKIALTALPVIAYMSAYVVLISTSNVYILPIAFILMGSSPAFYALIYSIVADMGSREKWGRIYGILGGPMVAAQAATPFIGGILYSSWNQLPFIFSIILIPLVLPIIYAARRKARLWSSDTRACTV